MRKTTSSEMEAVIFTRLNSARVFIVPHDIKSRYSAGLLDFIIIVHTGNEFMEHAI